eukprot:TRINITY_DN48069_c0_g1_i1.p1 TRINITY_DN48069_c0_g1~~TRINITY_DN48069_c0_g1_i1.p1  ORF type:complete len:384 (+),score=113.36 TRINITY_DN48069_c0_g1_i1:23-1174(+)
MLSRCVPALALRSVMGPSKKTFVPYSQRPEWQDVERVPQDDVGGVVSIRYSDTFVECHDYFRAVVARSELSPRVVELTEDVISCNPANYTAWKYRRDAILATGMSISDELGKVAEMVAKWPKNYQIWHHRRELLDKFVAGGGDKGLARAEKAVIDGVLAEDPKSIHVWGHRRWLCSRFDLPDGEIEATDAMIVQDRFNNSAWNYRFFLVESLELGLNPDWPRAAAADPCQVRARECQYALEHLGEAPGNEAVHNYLLGHVLPLRGRSPEVLSTTASLVLPRLQEHLQRDCPVGATVWCSSTSAEICAAAAQLGVELFGRKADELRAQARELYLKAASADPIRSAYWQAQAAGCQSEPAVQSPQAVVHVDPCAVDATPRQAAEG